MSQMRFGTHAQQDPGALALVDSQERRWTRGELASATNRMSRALRRAGLSAGDVFAIIAPNCFEYVSAYLAATQIGLYVVPVNWHLASPEIQYILEDCGARALLIHKRFASLTHKALRSMRTVPRILVATGPVEGFETIESFTADVPDAPLEDPEAGRPLSYTSATTGKPKGVVLPLADAERVMNEAIERRLRAGVKPDTDRFLVVSMLYHGAPLDTVAMALHMGNAVVLTETPSPEAVLQLIEKYQITQASVVPTLFNRLLALSESVRSRYSLSSLRRVTHLGAPCAVDVKRRMIEWFGPILFELYGATEGTGTAVDAKDWLKYPGTVGKPLPGSQLKILNDEGEELPTGTAGAIYMTRWMGDRFHYLGDPEKTRASHRGEFFTVGDVGYVNEEGFLFICDRKIDMIICSGMKIYSAEVENVLVRHDKVVDCAVFGVPDALMGEAVMAVVQPAPSAIADPRFRAELLRFVGRHLSATKVPRHLVLTPELPREPTGKVQKRRLREIYWNGGTAVPAPAARTEERLAALAESD